MVATYWLLTNFTKVMMYIYVYIVINDQLLCVVNPEILERLDSYKTDMWK